MPTVTILGKRWEFARERLDRKRIGYGYCDPSDKRGKRIVVDDRLTGQIELDTILHEFTHAGGYYLDEEWVEQFATDVARELWKLGYRRDSR